MLNKIINLVFPKECIWCWEIWTHLCKKCKKQLTSHPEICPYCHNMSNSFKTCLKCKENTQLWLDALVIWFKYNKIIKKIIYNFKYFHKKDLCSNIIDRFQLVILSNPLISQKIKEKNTIITYVPNHWIRKHFIKWYNQSELLANELWKRLNIDVVNLWQKVKYTKPQAKLNKIQRSKNLIWSFKYTNLNNYKWKTILIIDDITTTWSTLKEICKNIKQEINCNCIWVVLARN